MGCGNSSQTQSNAVDQTSTTTLPGATPEEIALRQQLEATGQNQNTGLNNAIDFAQNGDWLSLSPQSQGSLDAAFNNQLNIYNNQAKQYADYLAGSRGMRMSDTPIANQAISQYGLGLSSLNSDRAMAGLNLGLQSNTARFTGMLNAANTLPSGLTTPYASLFNERLAQPTTHTTGFGNVSSYNNPSLLSQVLQGTQAYNQWSQGNEANSKAATGWMGAFM